MPSAGASHLNECQGPVDSPARPRMKGDPNQAARQKISTQVVLPFLYMTRSQLTTVAAVQDFWYTYCRQSGSNAIPFHLRGMMILYQGKLYVIHQLRLQPDGWYVEVAMGSRPGQALYIAIRDTCDWAHSVLDPAHVSNLCAAFDQAVVIGDAPEITPESFTSVRFWLFRLDQAAPHINGVFQAATRQGMPDQLRTTRALAVRDTRQALLLPRTPEETNYLQEAVRTIIEASAQPGAQQPSPEVEEGELPADALPEPGLAAAADQRQQAERSDHAYSRRGGSCSTDRGRDGNARDSYGQDGQQVSASLYRPGRSSVRTQQGERDRSPVHQSGQREPRSSGRGRSRSPPEHKQQDLRSSGRQSRGLRSKSPPHQLEQGGLRSSGRHSRGRSRSPPQREQLSGGRYPRGRSRSPLSQQGQRDLLSSGQYGQRGRNSSPRRERGPNGLSSGSQHGHVRERSPSPPPSRQHGHRPQSSDRAGRSQGRSPSRGSAGAVRSQGRRSPSPKRQRVSPTPPEERHLADPEGVSLRAISVNYEQRITPHLERAGEFGMLMGDVQAICPFPRALTAAGSGVYKWFEDRTALFQVVENRVFIAGKGPRRRQ